MKRIACSEKSLIYLNVVMIKLCVYIIAHRVLVSACGQCDTTKGLSIAVKRCLLFFVLLIIYVVIFKTDAKSHNEKLTSSQAHILNAKKARE